MATGSNKYAGTQSRSCKTLDLNRNQFLGQISIYSFYPQILLQFGVPCKAYDDAYNALLTNPDPSTPFYQYNQGMASLYEYLSKNTGDVSRQLI